MTVMKSQLILFTEAVMLEDSELIGKRFLYQYKLTLEQHVFELSGSTHTWIFFFHEIHAIMLHYTWLVESVGTEPRIQRAQNKVKLGFLTIWRVSTPTFMLFKGQLYCNMCF